jgi:hypothetical protein
LFAVHPVNTESVSYLTGRSDMLYLAFLLGAFIVYLKSGKLSAKLLLSVFLFAASLLCRETAAVFPFLLLGYELIFKKPFKRALSKTLPFFGALAIYVLARFTFVDFYPDTFAGMSFYPWLLTCIKAFAEYIRIIFLPFGLHMERVFYVTSFGAEALFSLIIAVFFLGGLFAFSRKTENGVFWVFWFFIFLLPHFNILGLNAVFAEHWLYGAAIGIYFIIACGFEYMRRRIGAVKAYLSFSFLVVFFFAVTFARNFAWADDPSIFLDTLRYTQSPRVLNNMGAYYESVKEYDKAIDYYRRAIELKPDEPLYHESIAAIYMLKGRVDQALYHFQKIEEIQKGEKD